MRHWPVSNHGVDSYRRPSTIIVLRATSRRRRFLRRRRRSGCSASSKQQWRRRRRCNNNNNSFHILFIRHNDVITTIASEWRRGIIANNCTIIRTFTAHITPISTWTCNNNNNSTTSTTVDINFTQRSRRTATELRRISNNVATVVIVVGGYQQHRGHVGIVVKRSQ